MNRRWAASVACAYALVAALALAPPALGSWSSGAGGAGSARAHAMPAGSQPSASVSGQSVTVSWAQSSFAGGGAVDGYAVKRYSSGGTPQTTGAACTGTVTALTCTETGVPAGDWRYSITPKQGAWTGTESARSAVVTVVAPTLSLSQAMVTALPTTLAGSISGFTAGQTVTFRLDDPATGPLLGGSISPTPVPAGGGASASVTIPAGIANGAHTVYAVGSGGDTAAAPVTVAVPTFVKNVGTATCGGTSLAVTVPASGVAPGSTLVLRLSLRGSSNAAVTASDSQGNAYAVDRDVVSSNQRLVVLRGRVSTTLASGNTVGVAFPSAAGSALVVDEFSGIAADPLDAGGSGAGNSAAPSAAVTTTSAPDLLIGAVSVAGQVTATQPGVWSPLTGQSPNCGGGNGTTTIIGARQVAAATGTFTYNPTVSASGRWAAAVVAYKAG